MGCDIHNHVEYLRTINGEKKWICGDYFKVNPYYNESEEDEERPLELVSFCDNRNYGLFSLLANVRNYAKNAPISDPKGLPNDLSQKVKKDAEDWGLDGHSHSFFTLKELIDYQENQPKLKRSGMVSPGSAKNLDEKGILPQEWCQWTSNKSWVYREWEEKDGSLDHLIEEMKRRADELNVVWSFEWEDNPKEAYKKSENIRLVFWFDN